MISSTEANHQIELFNLCLLLNLIHAKLNKINIFSGTGNNSTNHVHNEITVTGKYN